MSDKMHTQERATYWERRWHNGPFHIVAMEVAKIENALKKSEKAFSNLQDDHLQLHQNCAALKREIASFLERYWDDLTPEQINLLSQLGGRR